MASDLAYLDSSTLLASVNSNGALCDACCLIDPETCNCFPSDLGNPATVTVRLDNISLFSACQQRSLPGLDCSSGTHLFASIADSTPSMASVINATHVLDYSTGGTLQCAWRKDVALSGSPSISVYDSCGGTLQCVLTVTGVRIGYTRFKSGSSNLEIYGADILYQYWNNPAAINALSGGPLNIDCTVGDECSQCTGLVTRGTGPPGSFDWTNVTFSVSE